MSVYRALWLTLAYVIGASGAAIALLHDSRGVNVAVAVSTGVAFASVALMIQRDPSPETSQRRIMKTAVAGAIVCFATTGLVLLFGPTALSAAVILLLISPTALHRLSSILQRIWLWVSDGLSINAAGLNRLRQGRA
jgi:mannose/fructose/N-acetylgalactosamine-specific phosphotransferase system component IIC